MTKGPIYENAAKPANLRFHEGKQPVTVACHTLQEAVVAFHNLSKEKKATATIAVCDPERVYLLDEIGQLHKK